MSDSQETLRRLGEDFQKLQEDLRDSIAARQKLESQRQENQGVQKEFAGLKDDANIYKLVGPVLLKQEKTEATLAVDGRLEFIDKEIQRIEKQIAESQEKSERKKMEIIQLQTQMQQQQQAGLEGQKQQIPVR
ncbi:MAG: hypothetical protein M1823_001540 [Watsoniomyces obsoletus]|nr:MAG: hypothetical protein M1823_001540 [Watsoniomyces obsoletus]